MLPDGAMVRCSEQTSELPDLLSAVAVELTSARRDVDPGEAPRRARCTESVDMVVTEYKLAALLESNEMYQLSVDREVAG